MLLPLIKTLCKINSNIKLSNKRIKKTFFVWLLLLLISYYCLCLFNNKKLKKQQNYFMNKLFQIKIKQNSRNSFILFLTLYLFLTFLNKQAGSTQIKKNDILKMEIKFLFLSYRWELCKLCWEICNRGNIIRTSTYWK